MLASEIITHIKNLKSGGSATDEVEVSDAEWMYNIDYYRAFLIRNQQKAGQTISPFIKQSFVVVVKDGECDAYSIIDIPKPIELHNQEMITRVGDYLQRTTSTASNWMDYSKYTSTEPRWYIKDNKLYIKNYSGPSKVPIEGVWESPQLIEEIKGNINPFSPYDFEYPISSTMVDQIYKLIMDAELRLLGLPKDNTNNSNEDIQQ